MIAHLQQFTESNPGGFTERPSDCWQYAGDCVGCVDSALGSVDGCLYCEYDAACYDWNDPGSYCDGEVVSSDGYSYCNSQQGSSFDEPNSGTTTAAASVTIVWTIIVNLCFWGCIIYCCIRYARRRRTMQTVAIVQSQPQQRQQVVVQQNQQNFYQPQPQGQVMYPGAQHVVAQHGQQLPPQPGVLYVHHHQQPAQPGLQHAQPGLQYAQPGLQHAQPGLQHAQPGMMAQPQPQPVQFQPDMPPPDYRPSVGDGAPPPYQDASAAPPGFETPASAPEAPSAPPSNGKAVWTG